MFVLSARVSFRLLVLSGGARVGAASVAGRDRCGAGGHACFFVFCFLRYVVTDDCALRFG